MPQWSTIVKDTSREDRGDIRRSFHPLAHPELGFQGCRTLYECLRLGERINPMGPCLGYRAVSTSGFATPYIYSTYTEVVARVNCLAAGLDRLQLVQPANEDGMTLLGLYLPNCPDWVVSEHAIYALGGATVPFYDTRKWCHHLR
jgi:long-chain acyl-CoA synthetase